MRNCKHYLSSSDRMKCLQVFTSVYKCCPRKFFSILKIIKLTWRNIHCSAIAAVSVSTMVTRQLKSVFALISVESSFEYKTSKYLFIFTFKEQNFSLFKISKKYLPHPSCTVFYSLFLFHSITNIRPRTGFVFLFRT